MHVLVVPPNDRENQFFSFLTGARTKSSIPRTAVKTKQVGGRRERGEGSALLVRDPIRVTEDAEMRRLSRPSEDADGGVDDDPHHPAFG